MEKKTLIAVTAIFIMCLCCGCMASSQKNSGKIRIVTTIFPEYDWTREILGDKADNADLKLLIANGVDLHSYQPTVDDVLAISQSDIFIYVGGESDKWVEDALKEAENKEMIVINLLETLSEQVKEEEIVEGMQGEEEEEDEDGVSDEETEYDEHVWLSLTNASVVCDSIARALSEKDSENASIYVANAEAYKTRLAELDGRYRDMVAAASIKTVLFGDRFPFRYLTDDYGLSYYAAFVGCSAETEASFETLIFLARKADELGINAILTIDGSDGKLAEQIRDNTESKDQKILSLDSMQSVTAKDIEAGASYISIMNYNLGIFTEALK